MADRLTIQRVPTGLADQLGLKTTGDLPYELAPQVVGTLPLWSMYGLDRAVVVSGTSAAVSAAQTIFPNVGSPTTVPQGQIWDVWSVSLSINGGAALGAGTTYRLAPIATRSQFAPQVIEILAPFQTFTTGDKLFTSATFAPGTFILRPTDFLGGTVMSGTFGIPVQFDIAALVVPYRI